MSVEGGKTMKAVLKPKRVWLAVLGVVALALAGVGAFAAFPSGATSASSLALNISWGRPTQAERDGSKLFFVISPDAAHTMEILVYVDGIENGKTYEIEVEVKETGGPENIKWKLKVEDLVGEEVPELPPADPRN
jgi:hypothetical protein